MKIFITREFLQPKQSRVRARRPYYHHHRHILFSSTT